MTNAIKANHDGSGMPVRSIADHQADLHAQPADSARAKLLADLKAVAADIQQLIAEATDASTDALQSLRGRIESRIFSARATLADARASASDNVKQAGAATRIYVTANPWKSAGMLAAAGVAFGFVLAKYHSASAGDAAE
jgi:ElaB/YqjD/DUF883 family membrane-anchored ribosome-binding protein